MTCTFHMWVLKVNTQCRMNILADVSDHAAFSLKKPSMYSRVTYSHRKTESRSRCTNRYAELQKKLTTMTVVSVLKLIYMLLQHGAVSAVHFFVWTGTYPMHAYLTYLPLKSGKEINLNSNLLIHFTRSLLFWAWNRVYKYTSTGCYSLRIASLAKNSIAEHEKYFHNVLED